ncbi:Mov34/MPN/PAD-1 [Candidatus Terasakiella magnetica]|nr:Mov34/MPN/PAD-1 [Candidatus Terasakiella magnetica]
MPVIVLTPAQMASIADAAEAAFPAEGCGLLVGTGRRTITVTRLVAAKNLLAGDGPDRFELDPSIHIRMECDLRGTPERIVGHWHSHPDGTAQPSATDLAMAWEPDLVWLIVGVAASCSGGGQVVQALAHRLDCEAGRSHPVPLRIAQNNACKGPGFPT